LVNFEQMTPTYNRERFPSDDGSGEARPDRETESERYKTALGEPFFPESEAIEVGRLPGADLDEQEVARELDNPPQSRLTQAEVAAETVDLIESLEGSDIAPHFAVMRLGQYREELSKN